MRKEIVEHAQRLYLLEKITSEIGHEINNSLSVIASRGERLNNKADNHQFVLETAELITQKCDEITKMVKMMREFVHPPTCKSEEINIVEALKNAQRFLPLRRDIQIIEKFNPVPSILGERNEIKRVFMALLIYAYEAISEKGGRIIIFTAPFQQRVKIEISHTGAGLPQEELLGIFDPLYCIKFGKAGFGLSFCHSIIIEKFKGDITAESTPEKGTKFTILLAPSQRGSE